jgi:hypothetical protein
LALCAAGICICMLLLAGVPACAPGSCPGCELGLNGTAESPSMPLSRDAFGIVSTGVERLEFSCKCRKPHARTARH